MRNQRCFIMALALTGVLLLAGPGLAQRQGAGAAGVCPAGNQVCTGGPGGVCVLNPANNQNNQTGRNSMRKQRRGPKGPGAGGQVNQPAAETKATEAGQ